MNPMTSEDLPELLNSLAQTPDKLSRMVEGLSERHLCFKNSADEFSALENICHLRDLEIEGYTDRIARILHETQPSLTDIDGSRLAIERDYNNQDASLALEDFTLARRRNVEILRELNEEQLTLEGTLAGVGVISLEKLLEMMRDHDEDHLSELRVIQGRFDRDQSAPA